MLCRFPNFPNRSITSDSIFKCLDLWIINRYPYQIWHKVSSISYAAIVFFFKIRMPRLQFEKNRKHQFCSTINYLK